jgi:hypothetical protein
MREGAALSTMIIDVLAAEAAWVSVRRPPPRHPAYLIFAG